MVFHLAYVLLSWPFGKRKQAFVGTFQSMSTDHAGLLASSAPSLGYRSQLRKPRKLTTVSFFNVHSWPAAFSPPLTLFSCDFFLYKAVFSCIWEEYGKVCLCHLPRHRSLLKVPAYLFKPKFKKKMGVKT